MIRKPTLRNLFRLFLATPGLMLFQQGQAIACSTDAWSSTTGTSTISAVENAVYEGKCGLSLKLTGGATAGWVEDATPASVSPAVTEYVARFYAYFDDAQLDNGAEIILFSATDANNSELFELKARGTSSGPVLYIQDTGSGKSTNELPIPPGWRAIVTHWKSSGELSLMIDEGQNGLSGTLTGLSYGSKTVNAVQLGIIDNPSGNVNGIVDIDSFMSRRSGTIGLTIQKSCTLESGTAYIENATVTSGSGLTCDAQQSPVRFGRRLTFDPNSNVTINNAESVTIGPGISIPQGTVLSIQ